MEHSCAKRIAPGSIYVCVCKERYNGSRESYIPRRKNNCKEAILPVKLKHLKARGEQIGEVHESFQVTVHSCP